MKNSASSFEIVESTESGIIIVAPKIHSDNRGFFCETFRVADFENLGIPTCFVQENFSRSRRCVFRGLHLQYDKPQGKLISVPAGKAEFYELDARPFSKFFGNIFSCEISEDNHYIMWVPPGMANGFFAKSEFCCVSYKCTEYWNKESEVTIGLNSTEIDLCGSNFSPIISEKDLQGITPEEWRRKYLRLFGNKNIF